MNCLAATLPKKADNQSSLIPLMQKRYSMITIIITFMMLIVLPATAEAALVRTYVGAGRAGDWHDSINWNPIGVPLPGDDIVIDGYVVTLKTTFTLIGSLTIRKSGAGGASRPALRLVLGASFINTGTVNLEGGNMFLEGGSFTNNGFLNASANPAAKLWSAGIQLDPMRASVTGLPIPGSAGNFTNNGRINLVGGSTPNLTISSTDTLPGICDLSNGTINTGGGVQPGWMATGTGFDVLLGARTVLRGTGSIVFTQYGKRNGESVTLLSDFTMPDAPRIVFNNQFATSPPVPINGPGKLINAATGGYNFFGMGVIINAPFVNRGDARLGGGIVFNSLFTNEAGAIFTVANRTALFLRGGMLNAGTLQLSTGSIDVSGPVLTNTGTIITFFGGFIGANKITGPVLNQGSINSLSSTLIVMNSDSITGAPTIFNSTAGTLSGRIKFIGGTTKISSTTEVAPNFIDYTLTKKAIVNNIG